MRIKQAEKYAGGRENGLIVAYRPNSCPASDFFSSGHEWTDYCIWAESIPRVEFPLSRTRVAPTMSRRSQPTLSMTYKIYKSKSILRSSIRRLYMTCAPSLRCLGGPHAPTHACIHACVRAWRAAYTYTQELHWATDDGSVGRTTGGAVDAPPGVTRTSSSSPASCRPAAGPHPKPGGNDACS